MYIYLFTYASVHMYIYENLRQIVSYFNKQLIQKHSQCKKITKNTNALKSPHEEQKTYANNKNIKLMISHQKKK